MADELYTVTEDSTNHCGAGFTRRGKTFLYQVFHSKEQVLYSKNKGGK
jgi:hypothetical protein